MVRDSNGRYSMVSNSFFNRGETEIARIPNNLRYISVQLIPEKQCSRNLPVTIDSSLICTKSTYNYGMCFGDSGGFLTVNGELVGIISHVYHSGCQKGLPDVCTNVVNLREWVEKNID